MKGVIGGLLLMSNLAATTLAAGPLTVDPDNPRYFTDGSGKAIYLTGSHVWANLPDISQSNPPAPFQYQAYLDFLEARGHNFVRLWTWAFPHFSDGGNWYADPFPWPRTGPGNADDGKPKFDLSKLNQDYFDRMRDRIVQAQARGMYVSVLLFDGYAVQFFRSSNNGFPFDAANNVNGINAPGTSSTSLQYSAVTALQETYVRKVIDTVNDLDNVLYEIANEAAPSSTSWQSHMIDFIRSYEATKPKQHPIGMSFQYQGGSNSTLFNSDADYISPNGDGGYMDNPPAADGSKVILLDTDHLWGSDVGGGDAAWVWKSFTRGLNVMLMDGGILTFPAAVDGHDPARNAMGDTLSYANRMDLAATTPTSATSACSTRYCLVDPGREYLVFQPGSGSFSVGMTAGSYAYEWFDPIHRTLVASGSVTVGDGSHSFSPPFSGNAVLYLKLDGAVAPAPPTQLSAN